MFSPEELTRFAKELYEIPDQIKKAGDEWQDAKQVADFYHDATKIVFAEEQNAIALEQGGLSEAKLQRLALASDKYKDWIKIKSEISSKSSKLHVKFTSLLNKQDALRTILSLGKEHLRMV